MDASRQRGADACLSTIVFATRPLGAFLDGVNAATLALMLVVTLQLGRAAIVDLNTTILAVISAVILSAFV